MKNKKNRILIAVLTIAFLLALGFLLHNQKVDKLEKNVEIMLNEDLTVTFMGSYTGVYMEDGSDEKVENVLMIRIQNQGTQILQYAEAELIFDDTTAKFSFSTLKPGESMIILEKNRLQYTEERKVKSTQLENVIYFPGELSYREDMFEISGEDGVFNVKNISGRDLDGNVAIYYKKVKDDIYQGGITYRAVIEGGIEKDGIKQIMTKHFTVDECKVMFVDYTEME